MMITGMIQKPKLGIPELMVEEEQKVDLIKDRKLPGEFSKIP